MANRDNHYEAAFEAYLRSRGVPYVAVDEARRSLLADFSSIKSLDYIVSAPGETTWLVDVKGRRFPGGEENKAQRTLLLARIDDHLHAGRASDAEALVDTFLALEAQPATQLLAGGDGDGWCRAERLRRLYPY